MLTLPLAEQTPVSTGATTGLGFSAAPAFLAAGAKGVAITEFSAQLGAMGITPAQLHVVSIATPASTFAFGTPANA